MSLDLIEYLSTHVGREQEGPVSAFARTAREENLFGFAPTRLLSWFEGFRPLLMIAPFIPYTNMPNTETKDNTATITRVAGGTKFMAQAIPSDLDDISIYSTDVFTLAQDKVMVGAMRFQVDDADKMGFSMGVMTAATAEVFTADPADGVYMSKLGNVATPIIGKVMQNAGTRRDVNLNQVYGSTDVTVLDGTDILVGFIAMAGASAALSWGCWWYALGSTPKANVATEFTADQLTALRAMLATTAPSLCAQIGFRLSGTAQKQGLVNWAYIGVER